MLRCNEHFELYYIVKYLLKLDRCLNYYVGTVNGPTSITRLGSFENVAKNCQFQFLDPPTPTPTLKIFLGGGKKNDVTEMIYFLITFQSINNVLFFF